MLIECAHCGAPLDVGEGERRTACAYCGRVQRVRSAKTLNQPEGWSPPAQWTPPQHFPAASKPLRRDPEMAARQVSKAVRGVLWGVGCTVLISLLVPGVIVWVVFSKTADMVEGVTGAGSGIEVPQIEIPQIEVPGVGVGTTSSTPLECVGPGSVVRTNAMVNVSEGPAVVVRDGCVLRLINTEVRGPEGIRVEGSGEVTMVNGSVAVEGTSVVATGTGRLTFTNVELRGERGVATKGEAQVRTMGGAILAGGVAIEARGGSSVTIQNTELSGTVERDPTATVRR